MICCDILRYNWFHAYESSEISGRWSSKGRLTWAVETLEDLWIETRRWPHRLQHWKIFWAGADCRNDLCSLLAPNFFRWKFHEVPGFLSRFETLDCFLVWCHMISHASTPCSTENLLAPGPQACFKGFDAERQKPFFSRLFLGIRPCSDASGRPSNWMLNCCGDQNPWPEFQLMTWFYHILEL